MGTRIITFGNIKGGVGKTTSVAALGDVLARKLGRKVLLIDADPQGSLSRMFGYGVRKNPVKTTFDNFLASEYNAFSTNTENPYKPTLFFNEAVWKRPRAKLDSKYENLRIMCSTPRLLNVYQTLYNDPADANSIISRFLFWLKDTGVFDYVLIDTFPNLSSALSQFILGSDYLMIPLPPSTDAIDGADRILTLFNTLTKTKENYAHKNLEFLGFFFCEIAAKGRADKTYRLNKGKSWAEETFFESIVPKSAAVLNSSNEDTPVTAAYPNNPASLGYVNVAKEMELRIKKMEAPVNGTDSE